MDARAAAAEATRERILDAAQRLFLGQWYEDVTLAVVAREAGVSGQTVLNHFGGKEGLFAAVVDRTSEELGSRRDRAEPGDVAGAIGILVDDYEITGEATIRLLAVEERAPSVREALDTGRRGHRDWVERIFRCPEATTELVVVTDAYTWKLLRRDRGMSRDETVASMRRMVEAILAHESAEKPRKTNRRRKS